MGVIVPSILTNSYADLEAKLKKLSGLAESVQIDVVDGRFAQGATWPYAKGTEGLASLAEKGGLQALGSFRYEIDLMAFEPEAEAGAWVSLGASSLVIHLESTKRLPPLIEELERRYGFDKEFSPDLLSLGLAVNIGTDTALLAPFLPKISFVQFMGIRTIGKQGQAFDPGVLEKIRAFHKEHPGVVIQADGGATFDTAPALLAAGVDRLVVGHGLWEAEDLGKELTRLEELALHYGTYE